MPILPLDHSEPLAATLGVMLYPGEDELDRGRARAWAARYLIKPIQEYLQSGGTPTSEALMRLYADTEPELGNLAVPWRDGLAMGQMFALYYQAAHTETTLASWENAARAVAANAQQHGERVSPSLLKKVRLRYRSVAHLWGAWCLRGGGIWPKPDVGYEAWHDFQFFLMEAEILLRWGQTWRPDRGGAEPPLPGEAWRVPADWEPPEMRPGWPKTRVTLGIPESLLVHFRKPGRPKKSA